MNQSFIFFVLHISINIIFSILTTNCLEIEKSYKNIFELERNLKDESLKIKPPKFSNVSGFYANEFELILTSEDNDLSSTIYYTIDSTNPITSNTSQIYKEPILITDRTSFPNIYGAYNYNEDSPVSISRSKFDGPVYNLDKSMVIRAVVKTAKGNYSEIISNVYFITTNDLIQYQDLNVISLVTNPENLFDPDTGIYVTGTRYINWKNSDEYDPKIGPYSTKNVCNFFMAGKEWEREASVIIFEKGKIIVNQNMGIRIKGSSTRNVAGKSFNLYARKEYGKDKVEAELLKNNLDINGNIIKKYKSFSIRGVYEPQRLNEKFARDLFSSTKNLVMPDSQLVVLFLNGEYWGAYLLIEKIDKSFIETNYLIPSNNVSMIKEGQLEEGPQEELDNFISFCKTYSKKDVSDEKVYEEINNFIDIDSMIEHFGLGIYIATSDWPQRNEGQWKNNGPKIDGNKYSDGKWRFMTFDLDYTMGIKYNEVGLVDSDHFKYAESKNWGSPTNLFIALLKNNKKFKNKFINAYCDFINEIFNPIKVNKLLEEYIEKYQEIVAYSQLRWWGYGSKLPGYAHYKDAFLKNSDNKKAFYENRPKYSLQHMKEYLGLKEELVELNIKVEGKGKIKINNILPELKEGKWCGKYFTNIPIALKAIPNEGIKFKEWSGDKTSDEESIDVSLTQNMTIIANFE